MIDPDHNNNFKLQIEKLRKANHLIQQSNQDYYLQQQSYDLSVYQQASEYLCDVHELDFKTCEGPWGQTDQEIKQKFSREVITKTDNDPDDPQIYGNGKNYA